MVVARRLGHRERLLDLLMQQERDARIQEKSWLRNRITEQAVLQAKGNPLRELEALYRRQRLLLEEPRFESNVWLALDPEATTSSSSNACSARRRNSNGLSSAGPMTPSLAASACPRSWRIVRACSWLRPVMALGCCLQLSLVSCRAA